MSTLPLPDSIPWTIEVPAPLTGEVRGYRLEYVEPGAQTRFAFVAALSRSNAITARPTDWQRKHTRAFLAD